MRTRIFFDLNLQLRPYKRVEMELAEFETTFVTQLADTSIRRARFEELLRYLEHFQDMRVTLWIIGSFVTAKATPGDIDVLMLLEDPWYGEVVSERSDFIRYAKRDFNIDLLYVLGMRDGVSAKTVVPGVKNNRDDGLESMSKEYLEWEKMCRQHKGMKTGFISVNIHDRAETATFPRYVRGMLGPLGKHDQDTP